MDDSLNQKFGRNFDSPSYVSVRVKKKRPERCSRRLKDGGDLLSHRIAVPSAQVGLTSLFGMGRGGAPPQ